MRRWDRADGRSRSCRRPRPTNGKDVCIERRRSRLLLQPPDMAHRIGCRWNSSLGWWRARRGIPVNRQSVQRLAQSLGFPPRQWSDGQQGLYAQYDEMDRLIEMHWLSEGVPGRWRLKLRPRSRSGELVLRFESEREDSEVYSNGQVELFDPWSDNRSPEWMRWKTWTRKSVASMLGQHRCLLCRQGVDDVAAAVHTEDEFNHLCQSCWISLTTQPPHGRAWPLGNRSCGACLESFGDEVLMHERRSGKLCLPCTQDLKPVDRPHRFWTLIDVL